MLGRIKVPDDWYASYESGVVIRRYTCDDFAAWEIARALEAGWQVLSHNVVWAPSYAIWFFWITFSDRTQHVVTYVKKAPPAEP